MMRQNFDNRDWSLKYKLAGSLLIIVLMTASLSGATYSWFTTSSSTPDNLFAVGTLFVEVSEPMVSKIDSQNSYKVKWTITNTGSISSYIRVRLETEENLLGKKDSIWNEGERYSATPERYFIYYVKGQSNSDNPTTNNLWANNIDEIVGTISIWEEAGRLFVNMTTNNYAMFKSDLYAGKQEPTIGAPGGFGFLYSVGEGNTHLYYKSYTFPDPSDDNPGLLEIFENQGGIKVDFSDIQDGTPIYIFSHADGHAPAPQATWNLHTNVPCSGAWEYKGSGYWYYLYPVSSGQEITICFLVCAGDASSGEITFYLEAEAVQASHNAAKTNGWLYPTD